MLLHTKKAKVDFSFVALFTRRQDRGRLVLRPNQPAKTTFAFCSQSKRRLASMERALELYTRFTWPPGAAICGCLHPCWHIICSYVSMAVEAGVAGIAGGCSWSPRQRRRWEENGWLVVCAPGVRCFFSETGETGGQRRLLFGPDTKQSIYEPMVYIFSLA